MKTILPMVCGALLGFCRVDASDWPQWRGPTRTAHVPAGSPAPDKLPDELKPAWNLKVGPAHSSPVIAGGKLVYLDEQESKEVIHVVDASTGKEIWSKPFANSFGDEWGSGPRSTPMIDGDRLYVQSCDGEFQCLNLADGKQRWRVNFGDYGVKFLGSKAHSGTASRRGNTGCGVVDGDRIFVPVGSVDGAMIVAFDKLTGKELWRGLSDEAAYSSLMVGTLAGTKQVVAFTADSLAGVDWQNGKVLWRVPLKTTAKRHAATPVIFGDSVVVNSHSIGLVCFRIARKGGEFSAERAWANQSLLINLSTPVLVGDHLYCSGPRNDYVCVEAATGKLKWSQAGFGTGKKDYASTIAVGSNLLVLSESGTLHLLKANPEKCEELGRVQVCGNTWSFPAYVDGQLYVRDARELRCFDLR